MTEQLKTQLNMPQARLGTTSVEEVWAAFADFKPGLEMGGHIRVGKPPFYKAGQVETTFNKDQLSLVATSMGYLNALAKGRVFGDLEPVTKLHQRIEAHFLAAPESFGVAIFDGVFDLLTQFRERYANLMPVLGAIYPFAASIGTLNSVTEAKGALAYALNGELTEENFKPVLVPDQPDFVKLRSHEGTPHEVWCLGQAFGLTIIDQSKIAALNLVKNHSFPNYDSRNERISTDYIYRLNNHVKVLVTQIVPSQKLFLPSS